MLTQIGEPAALPWGLGVPPRWRPRALPIKGCSVEPVMQAINCRALLQACGLEVVGEGAVVAVQHRVEARIRLDGRASGGGLVEVLLRGGDDRCGDARMPPRPDLGRGAACTSVGA